MAIDKVQPLKLEDPSSGTQLDAFPTSLSPQQDHIECAGIVLDEATARDEAVRIYRNSGKMIFIDAENSPHTLTDLLASAGGFDEEIHRQLNQLTHNIDETSYDEIVRVNGFVSSITTWDSNAKITKVREENITRVNGKVSQIVTIQYDNAGVAKETLTENFVRSGGKIISNTRVRS